MESRAEAVVCEAPPKSPKGFLFGDIRMPLRIKLESKKESVNIESNKID